MKKMTLSDIVSNINFNDKNIESDIGWEYLMNQLNIESYTYWFEQERLKAYFIEKWYCTDSHVGLRAYFLDNKFVALSSQSGRKMDEDFRFVSKEDALNLKKYIESLIGENEEFKVEILDLKQELDEFYSITYNSQILHKYAYYLGNEVEIIKNNYQSAGVMSDNYFFAVEVKFEDGRKELVDCRDLLFNRFSLD
jgi:regulator of replication initiation timing